MSELKQENSTVEADEPQNSQVKQKSKPSKSVRAKKQQSHREHINKGANAAKEAFMDKKYFSHETISAVLEQIKANPVQKVAREFEPTIDDKTISDISNETVEYLYDVGKITQDGENGAQDKAVLSSVLKSLAIVKIHVARKENGKFVDVSELEYIKRIQTRFTALPKVMNDYLANIGYFTQDGQIFVPQTHQSIQFARLAPGKYKTSMTQVVNGVLQVCIAIPNPLHIATYVQQGTFIGDVFQMLSQQHGTIEWMDDLHMLGFSDLCVRYEKLMSRCSRKVANAIEKVDLKGTGTVAQLVGSRDLPHGYREIWCNKDIDQGTLMIGGLFGYGFNNDTKWYDEDIACIRSYMDMTGIFTNIQRTQRM